jgi:hypothetical protein
LQAIEFTKVSKKRDWHSPCFYKLQEDAMTVQNKNAAPAGKTTHTFFYDISNEGRATLKNSVSQQEPGSMKEMHRSLKSGQFCYRHEGRYVMMSRKDGQEMGLKPVPLRDGWKTFQELRGKDVSLGARPDRSLASLERRKDREVITSKDGRKIETESEVKIFAEPSKTAKTAPLRLPSILVEETAVEAPAVLQEVTIEGDPNAPGSAQLEAGVDAIFSIYGGDPHALV